MAKKLILLIFILLKISLLQGQYVLSKYYGGIVILNFKGDYSRFIKSNNKGQILGYKWKSENQLIIFQKNLKSNGITETEITDSVFSKIPKRQVFEQITAYAQYAYSPKMKLIQDSLNQSMKVNIFQVGNKNIAFDSRCGNIFLFAGEQWTATFIGDRTLNGLPCYSGLGYLQDTFCVDTKNNTFLILKKEDGYLTKPIYILSEINLETNKEKILYKNKGELAGFYASDDEIIINVSKGLINTSFVMNRHNYKKKYFTYQKFQLSNSFLLVK